MSAKMTPGGTRLIRSGKGGATIHLNGCVRARGKTYPWNWAEGRDDMEWLVKGWLKPCRTCLPIHAIEQDDMRSRALAGKGIE